LLRKLTNWKTPILPTPNQRELLVILCLDILYLIVLSIPRPPTHDLYYDPWGSVIFIIWPIIFWSLKNTLQSICSSLFYTWLVRWPYFSCWLIPWEIKILFPFLSSPYNFYYSPISFSFRVTLSIAIYLILSAFTSFSLCNYL